MSENKCMRHGFYSAQAEHMLSTSPMYSFVDGEELPPTRYMLGPNGEKVTCFDEDREGAAYKWPDKVYVGYFDTYKFRPVE